MGAHCMVSTREGTVDRAPLPRSFLSSERQAQVGTHGEPNSECLCKYRSHPLRHDGSDAKKRCAGSSLFPVALGGSPSKVPRGGRRWREELGCDLPATLLMVSA